MKRPSEWIRMLWPVSLVYSLGARSREWGYRKGVFRTKKLPGKVISVGNLTVGGTGKTPMALAIAERLAQQGRHAAILTRGYRGTANHAASGLPQSDEVALMRERLGGKIQLGVGPDRYKNGMVLARHGVEWFVLDDGFQHLTVRRDVDVVLVDATDPFGGGKVLPAGRLREPVSALRRAGIVVVTRSVQAPSPAIESIIRRHTRSPIFYAATRLESVLRVPRLDVALPPPDWTRARFLAFCGIGNPAAFFGDLRTWGFQIAGQQCFPDHHEYTSREAFKLEQEAGARGADALLCTEKDVWNLRNVQFSALPVYCCRISLALPEEFWSGLENALGRGKASGNQ